MAQGRIHELRQQLSELRVEISNKDQDLGRLQYQLDCARERFTRNHTNLVLRYKMEKMEAMSKPANVTEDAWKNTSRSNKWKSIFENEAVDFVFHDFVHCVRGICVDSDSFARKMKLMYSILNNRIHEYVETDDISTTSFREDEFNRLSGCLDNVTIR